jgi:multiple sugar transport system permease protein
MGVVATTTLATTLASTHRRPMRRWAPALLTTSPALLWFSTFMIGPLVAMFVLSMTEWNSLLADPAWLGFDNFRRVFEDPIIRTAAKNSVMQLTFSLALMIPLAFLLGFFLSRKPRGYRIFSIILFTPAIVSASARAVMFKGIYQPNGIVNKALDFVGLDSWKHIWLADQSTSLWTIVAVDVWAGIGFTGVIFAAALTSVSEEIYEAARIDGIGTWGLIWKIAFPITKDFVRLMTMLQFLWLFLGSAQNVLLLTKGGPGDSSMTLSYYLYDRAFVSQQLGYSQAIGVVLFFVGVTGMLLIRGAFGVEWSRRFRRVIERTAPA